MHSHAGHAWLTSLLSSSSSSSSNNVDIYSNNCNIYNSGLELVSQDTCNWDEVKSISLSLRLDTAQSARRLQCLVLKLPFVNSYPHAWFETAARNFKKCICPVPIGNCHAPVLHGKTLIHAERRIHRRLHCASTSEGNQFGYYFAGMVSGLAETVFSHPLDTLKVRMQTLRYNGMPTPPVYQELALIGGGSLRGLYNGFIPSCLRNVLAGAIFMGTNESFKSLFGAEDDKPTSIAFVAAAMATGVVETLLYCPFELAKTQLQVGNHTTTRDCAQHLYKSNGLRGLFLGFNALMTCHLIGNITFFSSYAMLQYHVLPTLLGSTPSVHAESQSELLGNEQHMEFTTLSTTIAGGVAGALSVSCDLLTQVHRTQNVLLIRYYLAQHPFDTIQNCIMSQKHPGELYRGLGHCTKCLIREGGFSALMRGVKPSVIGAFPGGAAAMLAYESVVHILYQR